jgi:single-strand DNA-binding protein
MSANVNKVLLLGRLGKDPELRYTQSGTATCTFRIATSKRYTDKLGAKQEETQWHQVVAWGRQAEVIAQHAKKGSLIFVEGELKTRRYEDKDKILRQVVEIYLQSFQFVGPAQGEQEAGSEQFVESARQAGEGSEFLSDKQAGEAAGALDGWDSGGTK